MYDVGLQNMPVVRVGGASSHDRQLFYQWCFPRLARQGLSAAILRVLDADGVDEAGAVNGLEVAKEPQPWQGAGWSEYRVITPSDKSAGVVARLARGHDLLLLDGCPDLPVQHCRISPDPVESAPDSGDTSMARSSWEDIERAILHRLQEVMKQRPVWACILIGGKSSRMGSPKHLLPSGNGRCWLEEMVATLQPQVEGIALSGEGEVPESLAQLPRLADIPGVAGPLTGITAAMRWQPDVTWLLLACDMPRVTGDAVGWLKKQRQFGTWAVLPSLSRKFGGEPLFACYEPQCAQLFEEMVLSGERRIRLIAENKKIRQVMVPADLQEAWKNINTIREFHGLATS